MHVISIKTLKEFWEKHRDAENQLRAWYQEAKHADWDCFATIRHKYPSADQVDRYVIFNICHNNYRLVVKVEYKWRKVYVKFVGSHAEYDRIDWL